MLVCICTLMFRIGKCILFDGIDQVDEDPYTNLNQEEQTSTKNRREDVLTVSHICAFFVEKSKLGHCNCVSRYDIHYFPIVIIVELTEVEGPTPKK